MGGVVSALVLLALTSLVGSLLKGPIDDLASRDRLRAEVQLSPWFEKPSESEAEGGSARRASAPDEFTQLIERIRAGSYARGLDSDDFEVARIIITNESSGVVTNANFRLRAPHDADLAVVVDQSGEQKVYRDIDRVFIPDLKPGDRATVFLWGNYSSLLFPDLFETYSSSGRFRVTYDWPRQQGRQFGSPLGSFLDDYAGEIFAGTILLLTMIFAILAVAWEGYVKALLKDEALYQVERQKFEQDPKKFKPDLNASSRAKTTTPQTASPESAPPP